MHSTPVQVIIPDGLEFSALKLQRDPTTLDVSFDWAPIEAVCTASGMDLEPFRRGPEDNVSGLIMGWYRAHLAAGGKPDPVAAQLVAEVEAEGQAGDPARVISHGGSLQ